MFVWALGFLTVLAGLLIFISHRFCKSKLLDNQWEAGDHNIAVKFQRNWLLVFGLVQVSMWMQAPYLFRLYASYGYSHSEIVNLFLITYASSALLGTIVGSSTDRIGRRTGCYLFLGLFSLSTLAKYDATGGYDRVAISHAVDGIALSLLYTSFEAWMVSENFASCFPQPHLHRTSELGSIMNGGIAVSRYFIKCSI